MAEVYSITHIATGREYVGFTSKTVSQRWRAHRAAATAGKQTHFARALRKYGPDAFDIKLEAVLPTNAEAKLAERILIALRAPAFNMTSGGDGTPGHEVSAEARARMGYWSGKTRSLASRAKVSASLTGRQVSEATRAKLSAKHAGRVMHPQTPEVRAKISATLKADPAVKERMRKAREARWGRKVGK